jgi:hypothetical protein
MKQHGSLTSVEQIQGQKYGGVKLIAVVLSKRLVRSEKTGVRKRGDTFPKLLV